jgi:hypothetical protein
MRVSQGLRLRFHRSTKAASSEQAGSQRGSLMQQITQVAARLAIKAKVG